MSHLKDKTLIGKYKAHPTRAGAIREARREAIELPGVWRGTAVQVHPDDKQWLPVCVHVNSGAELTRGAREWYCTPKHLRMPTRYSRKPLTAVRKMAAGMRAALNAELDTMAERMNALRREKVAIDSLKKVLY